MKRRFILAISTFLIGPALPVSAAVVSLAERQAITQPGETFEFNFDKLPASDGTGGYLIVVLNGDYTGHNRESAVVTLDAADGMLDVGGRRKNGVITNTIAGLTLKRHKSTEFGLNDHRRRWRFAVSGSLLDALLADDQITVNIQNDPDVGINRMVNPDFVRVRLIYNESPAVIPIPPALPLLLTALIALAAVARRHRHVI